MGQMTHYGCDPSPNFLPQEYALPQTLTTFRTMVKMIAFAQTCTFSDLKILTRADFIFLTQLGMKTTMTIYPFFIHAIFMSIFASVIGPFGGFFASGFKRAFKIKVRD